MGDHRRIVHAGAVRRQAVVLGLGHIGASLAVALASRGWKVLGWDRSRAAIRYCCDEGWISPIEKDALGELQAHNLICVVALPEHAVGDAKFVQMLGKLPPGTIVTDVFSSKGQGTEALGALCASKGLRHGWSHPLAGREGQGAASADASIFNGACVLIDAQASAMVRAELTKFWQGAAGCRTELVTTEIHQKRMAAGSHLMHAVAFSLMHAIERDDAASPSVLGMTRVAKSSPVAWAEILRSNRDELEASLARLSRELERIVPLLRKNDGKLLEKYLMESRRLRIKMESKK